MSLFRPQGARKTSASDSLTSQSALGGSPMLATMCSEKGSFEPQTIVDAPKETIPRRSGLFTHSDCDHMFAREVGCIRASSTTCGHVVAQAHFVRRGATMRSPSLD